MPRRHPLFGRYFRCAAIVREFSAAASAYPLVSTGRQGSPRTHGGRAMLNAISDLSELAGPPLWPQRAAPRPPLADVARYIEANSSERIALKDLALVAELSVFR